MSVCSEETIVACATAPGQGGVGIVRLSGPDSFSIALSLATIRAQQPRPRYAYYCSIVDSAQVTLDQGIVIFFPGPYSFTGEDVVEIQGHGGPIIIDAIIKRATELGARLARPGEFSERAFLNDKIDLVQAEAIADLISSSSEQAAVSAMRSLQGAFSAKVNLAIEQLVALRIQVEAAIDFPDEEVDFINDNRLTEGVETVRESLSAILERASQGVLLREGLSVVIAGKPNAGKSSLLNALAGQNRAIVTDIAGTTRDLLQEHIHLDGLPLNIVDTAGLRESQDIVEREGIKRAHDAIAKSDKVLLLVDAREVDSRSTFEELANSLPGSLQLTPERLLIIVNKIDLTGDNPGVQQHPCLGTVVHVSIKTGVGLKDLSRHIQATASFNQGASEFSARRRHVVAIENAMAHVEAAKGNLNAGAGELVAEDLSVAQRALGAITGEVTPDDLLGKIFSSFCIGK